MQVKITCINIKHGVQPSCVMNELNYTNVIEVPYYFKINCGQTKTMLFGIVNVDSVYLKTQVFNHWHGPHHYITLIKVTLIILKT